MRTIISGSIPTNRRIDLATNCCNGDGLKNVLLVTRRICRFANGATFY